MVDYTKWKDIEISDDEDDTHPNIDTPSLFRWRHQARVQRMEELEQEKRELQKALQEHETKFKTQADELEKAKSSGAANVKELEENLKKVEEEFKKLSDKEDDMNKKEQMTPWNVDTISKAGFSKTVINTSKNSEPSVEGEPDDETGRKMKVFVNKHEAQLKKFGLMEKYEESAQFLMERNQLVCEDTAHYLVVWCINLVMDNKHSMMEKVAHQCICMQYILELGRKLGVDPRVCITAFFSRIQNPEPEYRLAFQEELRGFKDRLKVRAEQKLQLALKEIEDEERKARMGPGGLDPFDVLETLPKDLQECFETQNVEMLQDVLSKMPETDARRHLKRCIDAGLWVPDLKRMQDGTPIGPADLPCARFMPE